MSLSEIEKDMSAVAFAEAGEHETAREFMAASSDRKTSPAKGPVKKKPYLKTLIFGAISISAYVLLFSNEELITSVFTRGGMYTFLPVGTAFFFSFTHGAFASNLLSVLNLEAKK